MNTNSLKPIWLLPLGILAIALTHTTYSIDFFAWFSNVPFLIYLSLSKGWKARAVFTCSLIVAWSFVVLKIITPPIPYAMIFLFSVPISLIHLPAYLIWDRFKGHKGAFLLFPAILTLMEWIQYTFTPFASWGVMAYSQSHSENIMQLVSVAGLAGLSFIIYWINISVSGIILTGKFSLSSFWLPFSLLFLIIVFGSVRIDTGKSKGYKTIAVATVGTTSGVGGLPLPSEESNESVKADLFQMTIKAAKSGAELMVWNEAAFYALPEDEMGVIDSVRILARQYNVSIVASYVKPVSMSPLKYENKLRFINSSGEVEYSYLKHQPVPGEPAIKGREPFKTVQVGASKVGAAICYDYDFPYVARKYGNQEADIVALPSSDWRGIDPLHTRMAAFRAIEQGHSVIRSTRFGLSAAISPYGEIISQSSSFDENSRIMIADMPSHGFTTIYASLGDFVILLCAGYLVAFSFLVITSGKKNKDAYDLNK